MKKTSKPDELRDDEPDRARPASSTIVGEVERLAHQHDAEHGQRQRDLVRDELRARAHRAEQRELRLRRPAADDGAVDPDRAEREDQDQADRDVGDLTVDLVAEDRQPAPNGITANAASAVNIAMTGAAM